LLSFARRFHDSSSASIALSRQTILDFVAETRYKNFVLLLLHSLSKFYLQMSLMQLNELYVDFDFENLRRHRFEVITVHFQTLLLHFDKLRRCIDDVIWAIMQRISNDRCVNDNKSDYRFVNQSCSNKTRFSNEDDETRQRQRLSDHFFLNVLDVSFSFELDVDLHFQNANLTVFLYMFYTKSFFLKRVTNIKIILINNT
jgi:hypothetical protein